MVLFRPHWRCLALARHCHHWYYNRERREATVALPPWWSPSWKNCPAASLGAWAICHENTAVYNKHPSMLTVYVHAKSTLKARAPSTSPAVAISRRFFTEDGSKSSLLGVSRISTIGRARCGLHTTISLIRSKRSCSFLVMLLLSSLLWRLCLRCLRCLWLGARGIAVVQSGTTVGGEEQQTKAQQLKAKRIPSCWAHVQMISDMKEMITKQWKQKQFNYCNNDCLKFERNENKK